MITKGYFTPYRLRGPRTMPFGKYEGRPVDTLPTKYLCWLVTIPRILRQDLAAEIEQVHQDRCGRMHSPEEFPGE